MTFPEWSTRIRSDLVMRLKARPKGFTQKQSGCTGSRRVMWPATPSSKPYLPKIRKAAARRPFWYSRSSCLSVKVGGLGGEGVLLVWELSSWLRCDVLLTGRGKAGTNDVRCQRPGIILGNMSRVIGMLEILRTHEGKAIILPWAMFFLTPGSRGASPSLTGTSLPSEAVAVVFSA